MANQGTGSWPARRARMTPDKTAIVHDGRAYSYAELHDRATRVARRLRGFGVGHGDRVAYLGRNLPALAETLFGAGLLGAVFVPLNYRLAPPELAQLIGDCAADVLVWDAGLADAVTRLKEITAVSHYVEAGTGSYENLLEAASAEPIDEPVGLDELCMIQYTSGTSGRAKGVALTHANIAWNCYNMLIDVDVSIDEVSLVSAPMFHTAALNQLFLPTFLKGGTSILMTAFDPGRALDLIGEHRVTWMFGVPAMFAAMARSPRWPTADLSSVRILMCGGAPVPEPLIRSYQERGLVFAQGYGLTETSPGALFLRAHESAHKIGSAGTPCFFTDVRVVGLDLADVAAGQTGEVIIRGPNVTQGYWQQPDATRAAFTDDGWLSSGDAATVDDEGYVFIRGRVKDMFVSGGENIYPAEVEHVLGQHPAIAECAVIGVPDERWGEVGRAVVVLADGAEGAVAPGDLLGFLDGKLARYKIPMSVVCVRELPRNATGKILKNRLREEHGAS
jgi:fatty-acyl-CoA synthase